MVNENDLDEIKATALKVASEHEAQHAAVQAERKAEASLLSRVVEATRPALRALASAIRQSETTYWPTNTETATRYSTVEGKRGLRVEGDGIEKDCPRANEGSYVGQALYLLDDGTFLVLAYEGQWSNWQGASSSWKADVTPVAVEDVPSLGWNVEKIVATLAERLKSHEGKRAKSTQSARERASKLEALARLL